MLPNFWVWKLLVSQSLGFILTFMATFVSAQSSVITYLASSENKVNGSTELIRLVDGKIESRLPLGREVVYGYSDSHLAAMGSSEESGLVLRTWSLSTGEELTRCVLSDLPASPLTMLIGSSSTLFLEPNGSQVFYTGSKKEKRERKLRSGRRVPYDAMVTVPVVVDVHTGKSVEIEPPFDLPQFPGWEFLGGRYGLRSKDGIFAFYNSNNNSFEKEIDFSGAAGHAGDWSVHIPGLGFAKTDKQRKTILLANVEAVPLKTPRIISEFTEFYLQRFCSDIKGQPLLFVVTPPKKSSTTIMIQNLGNNKEIFQKEFPIEVGQAYVANDCHAWLLEDKKSKRAIYYDKKNKRTIEIFYEWASLPKLIPYFGME